MISKRILLSLFFIFQSVKVFAAPCCGGTANIPSLITGDDEAQLTASIVSGNVIAEAPVGGGIKFRKENDNEDLQSLRLDGAMILSDRTQAGFTLPILRRARSRGLGEAAATGLGDLSLTLGYEILPEWNYSSWEPRGLVFVSGTVPTGGSIYDATQLYNIDSRGRGFWIVSSGALFTKIIGNWDFSLLMEAHRGFSRKIENSMGALTVSPGWGGSGLFSLGVSPGGGNLRVGVSVAPSFEAPIETSGIMQGQGNAVSLWTSSAQLGYLMSRTFSMSLIYSDQTLIRASDNSALNRAVAFLIQKRWER